MVNLLHQMRTIKKYWVVQSIVTMKKKKIKMTQIMMSKWKKLWLALQISTKLFRIAVQMMMTMKRKKQITLLMKQTAKKKMVVLMKMMQMRLLITYWLVRARRIK